MNERNHLEFPEPAHREPPPRNSEGHGRPGDLSTWHKPAYEVVETSMEITGYYLTGR
ncbi:pyrroloquinoline quinone precursor peptide PqqA [Thermomonospora umbrina]|uniref:Coenzyme PQQ synthesis protein A n=1 Tax=Thermomonospora umbrina TaxID=111806 RepID=A0A3D9SNT5_9ACTN|nr:pyrroloquinoline quinone precursor peptide PqqA [Thermomonospora umbrina]REE97599.1 coenzyme PQQ precursor peptide PqqA [Thermomonospora umbrina]